MGDSSEVKQRANCDLGLKLQDRDRAVSLLFKIAVYSRSLQFQKVLINLNVREFAGSVSCFGKHVNPIPLGPETQDCIF